MSVGKIRYTDDRGETDTIGEPVADILPPPDQLVIPDDGVKVTLTLNRRSIDFFRHEARNNRVPYQRMIRSLVDGYAQLHRSGTGRP